jgi:pimeloyl-ACP methyl ester carboxylesterase
MRYPLYDFGGSGPVLHIAIANGFPPQTYIPLVGPLTAHHHAVCLPPRALWPDADRLEKPASWETLGDDLLAGLREHDLTGVVAVGHSFGAIASMLAVIQEPARFRALCLLDPTILPDHALALVDQARAKGLAARIPLAMGARRRKQHFASKAEALAYWQDRALFADWPEESLQCYVDGMLRPAADDGFELTWPPEWEAHYYETVYTRPWPLVERLRGLLPVLVVSGGTSDTFVEASARKMRDLLPEAAYRTVPGCGHLFPQAAPDAARAILSAWLDGLPAR